MLYTLGHPDFGVLSYEFAHSKEWKLFFYAVLLIIAAAGWFLSKDKKSDHNLNH
ncbi:hypothetical protein [Ureibacillus chungkukjangi]|uniref:hypothetical protein n=1 Tax=Ureibacillus chungkukjangi TaxID=1202712 RepID=UPI0015E8BC0A|nr:hypothetical protein [Ureibacillus chungkukjangi]